MQVRPALKNLYRVAGRSLSIEAADEWSASAVSHLFERWFVTPLPNFESVADGRIKIRAGSFTQSIPDGFSRFEIPLGGTCYTDQHAFFLQLEDSTITFSGKTPVVEVFLNDRHVLGSKSHVTVVSQAFSAALRRCGVFELHSAAVVAPANGKGILIAGQSGSGKSTLTLQLAMNGWHYVTDDVVLLEQSNHSIQANALRRFFAVTQKTVAATQVESLLPETEARFRKKRFDPQSAFPTTQVQQVEPSVIVFPEITPEPESSLRQLNQAETMSRLLRLCPWSCYDTPTADDYLRVLQSLAQSTTAYELLAGSDLIESSQSVTSLFSRL